MIYLPKELIIIILEYTGNIKYRLGKYMNQINTEDIKYNIIKENIQNKIIIINEVITEKFLTDLYSKLRNKINLLYSFNRYYPLCTKRIIYKTVTLLIPPYRVDYYYMYEHFYSEL